VDERVTAMAVELRACRTRPAQIAWALLADSVYSVDTARTWVWAPGAPLTHEWCRRAWEVAGTLIVVAIGCPLVILAFRHRRAGGGSS